jgi:(R,R)-butanediol dehydrogenase/meso-butanediol dehydrogenase/diacetyl reductase
MLAARWWGRKDVRVEEIPDPGPLADGWIRVRIEACGICGTDMEEYELGPVLVPPTRHPLSHTCAPLTLGHEGVGVVEEIGPGVTSLAVGTRVAIETNLSCGTCWWCVRGQTQLCPMLASLGLMGDGALAEYMVAPATMCAAFSTDVPVDHAALAEPLSVAVRAVRKAGVQVGSIVGVVGAGTVGLLTTQVARLSGASTILVVDRLKQRRDLAVKLGADMAVAPEDAAEAALALSDGRGLDIAIVAAGNAAAAEAAIRLTRKGGRSMLLGVFDAPVMVPMIDMLMGEKEVHASLSHNFDTDFLPAVDLIDRGVVELAPLITDRIALGDVVEQGFVALARAPEEHLKIIVYPNGTPGA